MNDISLSLSQGAYMDCGNAADLSMGGFAPYTLEGWIYLTSTAGMQSIISKSNTGVAAEYGFWVANGVVQSYRNVAPWVIQSQTVLQPNQWYHVATTYDGATLSLYINGLLEASSPFTSQPGFPALDTLIGAYLDHGQPAAFFQGYIYEVRVWNVCRTAGQIFQSMDEVGPADTGLVADFGFWQMPPADVSLNSHPLTPVGAVGNIVETAGVSLQGSAYVDCGNAADLSMGGFAPYTLEGWIYLTSTAGMQSIISKSNTGVAEYGLWVSEGVVQSSRNVAPWIIMSQTVLQPNQWYHVATTYDGATLSLYINGLLEASSPFTSQPGFPALNTLIGAFLNNNGQPDGFFQGYIQTMRVWRLALTPSQLSYAMSAVPVFDMGLVANFDFSLSPASDLTQAHNVQMQGGAALSTLVQNITQTQSVASPLLTPGHLDSLTAEYERSLRGQYSAEGHSERVAEYSELLRELAQKAEASPHLTGPHTTVVRRANGYHFHFYVDGVLKNEFFMAGVDIDPFYIWLAQFYFTLFNGFTDICFNFTLGGEAWKMVWNRILKNADMVQQIINCVQAMMGGVGALAILNVIDFMYGTGLLKMALKTGVTTLGWIGYAQIATGLLSWLAPGWKQAALFVKLAGLVLKLGFLINDKPPFPHRMVMATA